MKLLLYWKKQFYHYMTLILFFPGLQIKLALYPVNILKIIRTINNSLKILFF